MCRSLLRPSLPSPPQGQRPSMCHRIGGLRSYSRPVNPVNRTIASGNTVLLSARLRYSHRHRHELPQSYLDIISLDEVPPCGAVQQAADVKPPNTSSRVKCAKYLTHLLALCDQFLFSAEAGVSPPGLYQLVRHLLVDVSALRLAVRSKLEPVRAYF